MTISSKGNISIFLEGRWIEQSFSDLKSGQIFKMLHEEGIGVYTAVSNAWYDELYEQWMVHIEEDHGGLIKK
ncbi:hypothetical protein [Bacillus altitudinis]|uniref:hypothetical protein n=1 Tax=Bacillus altitudinis TaxID=293387 RepID=UPI001BCD1A3E|nr:hypothetical protein [Bacillus altitudinis]MBS4747479.1 hypothetical protein [Bacillus altitudinis]